ncbi:hypothetical protein [Bradyrhizobium sp. URHA0013]|uniref:hypothetical protein n=1 Tax=Bradyrhizobium sp. URHA0013 TaxID=1380352 RepID=UPI0012DED98D|nr:hypothetical protein [Bradyrhizobium sp. URHA0013]
MFYRFAGEAAEHAVVPMRDTATSSHAILFSKFVNKATVRIEPPFFVFQQVTVRRTRERRLYAIAKSYWN